MKLKVLSLFVLILIVGVSASAQSGNTTPKDSTEMIFNEVDHNFGNVAFKSDVSFEFVFKNSGKSPLIIKNVQSTCGCTVPSYDTQPVLPKGKGKIVVKYDSERIGPFIKTIKVYANSKNSPVDLTIRGEIKAADK